MQTSSVGIVDVNLKEGRIKLFASVVIVRLATRSAGTGDVPYRMVEDEASQWYSQIYRSVYWDEMAREYEGEEIEQGRLRGWVCS
jgi:hypothetical protein